MNIIKLANNVKINTLTNEIVKEDNGIEKTFKVENQLVQILLLLLKNDGELVTKETFIKEIWEGNKYIGEKALTKNIFKLRHVLKTNDISNVRIETIPKKGYRIIVNEENSVVKKRKITNYLMVTTIIILLAVVFTFFINKEPQKPKLQYFDLNTSARDSVIYLGDEELQVIKIDTLKSH